MNLNITPEMVMELYGDQQTREGGEEATALYVGRDGWTVGIVPEGLPDGLPTCLAIVDQPGVILHHGNLGFAREDAMARFTSGRYTIPFEDGTAREPGPGETPQIAFADGLKSFDPDHCWWFDSNRATLMAAEHEDVGDGRYSLYRTDGGRYIEIEHVDDPDAAWYLPFQVARSLTPLQAAQHVFDQYPYVSDDTEPDAMSGLLAVVFQLGRMMGTFETSLVKVTGADRELRDGDYRIAHAKQQFADAGDLAEFVRNDLQPALRAKRVDALRDLLKELELRSERPCTFEELLPEAAEVLGVSVRTVAEMFKRG